MSRRKTVINPETGEKHQGTSLDIIEAREPFAYVTLEDNTMLRIKLVIIEVIRSDTPGPDGRPQFSIEGQLITNVHVPEDDPQDE